MDVAKTGRFISARRKEKNLTQGDLAERLGISDRAVSKWERGNCLPDAGKMLELCGILGISVNELLGGEKIEAGDSDKKAEGLLLEMAHMEERKNKKMMLDMWVLLLTAVVFYTGLLALASYALKEGPLLGFVICASTLVLLAVCFYALKLEVDAGWYECKNCHHKFTPTYLATLFAPHMSTTRFLRCPECGKRGWAKKVMRKD